MGIDALTSAFATLPNPAVGTASVSRERQESASSPESAQPTVPKVVFNPRSHFDASAGVFVMEFRNADSGEVERQFPDENQLRAYANAKKLEAESAAEPKTPDAPAPADSAPAQPQDAGGKAPPPVRIQV
ncbi:hypothetical protein [Azospirillum sp. TSO22-1]|uniref:hypothetical protein n=1 Tax=Azospirillum sp. TSO22-1 TaxID=716789 RepID=UPI000D60F249|nr:hypothetical protein [Azospirillum sp. TSO22-1]PWC54964.1 hypothetical protein TSO221_06415 [Azospirillum sp. TSO22-1]